MLRATSILLALAFFVASSTALAQASDASSPEAQIAYERAVAAQEAGAFDEALRSLGEAQRLAPDNGRFIWRRVLILEAMGESGLARNVLEQQRSKIVEHIDPKRVDAKVAELEASDAPTESTESTELRPESDPPVTSSDDAPARPTRSLGLVVTGIGATFGAASVALFLVAWSDERQLDCSTTARTDCDGVTLLEDLDEREIRRRAERTDTLRTAGWISAGFSVALLAWGTFELLTFEGDHSGSAALFPWIGQDAAGATVRVSFR